MTEFSTEGEIEIKQPEPDPAPLCQTVDRFTGVFYRNIDHEPDTELETNAFKDTVTRLITLNGESGDPVAHVRICRRCRLLYVEDIK